MHMLWSVVKLPKLLCINFTIINLKNVYLGLDLDLDLVLVLECVK